MDRCPTTRRKAASAPSFSVRPSGWPSGMARICSPGSSTLNRKLFKLLMRYCTTIWTSTMFRSPEIINASSRNGVFTAASLDRKPNSMRRVSVTSTTSRFPTGAGHHHCKPSSAIGSPCTAPNRRTAAFSPGLIVYTPVAAHIIIIRATTARMITPRFPPPNRPPPPKIPRMRPNIWSTSNSGCRGGCC